MSFLGWAALAGALLLLMAVSPAFLGRLPVATSTIYLALGFAIGPAGLGWLSIDVGSSTPWLERVTEVAVVVSLFVGGLKLRLSLREPAWRAAYRLAGPVMLASILGVAAFAHLVFGLGLAASCLLGAVLAPTDPVLAAAVSVKNAEDHDRLRYAVSGEAGLNDGMAFPFVVFALTWAQHDGAGAWILEWAGHRIVWAVPAGLLLGYVMGRLIGRAAIDLRTRHGFNIRADFQALGLIALSYVGAELIGAWGFLSVFAAGLGLRHAEVRLMREYPGPRTARASKAAEDASVRARPAEALVGVDAEPADPSDPAVATGLMVAEMATFGDTAERLMEVLLVVLVGALLVIHWDTRAVLLAAALFLVVRPLATQVLLAKSLTPRWQRWAIGWLGIRGIGSIYYLTYALSHGAMGTGAVAVANLTLSTVALSIVVHGATINAVLAWYERRLTARDSPSDSEAS